MPNNPHIQILLQLARIDGDISESELRLIREIGASKFVSNDDIEEIMRRAQLNENIPGLESLTSDERVDLITNLVMVMRVDGRIELREMSFCFDIIKKLGFSQTDFFNLVVGVFDQGSKMERDTIRNFVERGFKAA